MTFGEQNSLSESYQLLDKALDSGINFFDSAEMYPVPQRAETQGRSEEYLGRWIRHRRIPRHRLVLATKVAGPSGQMTWIRGGPQCLDAKNIAEAIDNSLLRLQTDYIDLYQIHWPDRYVPMFGEAEYDSTRQYCSVPIEEQLDILSRAVNAGKIRYIGLSNETPYGVMKFLQAAEKVDGLSKIVSLQNSYNLLCRTFDSALAECCHHESIFLLAYSPLAMGILSGKYLANDGGPPYARLNCFRGRYSEGESRYNLSKAATKAATKEYIRIAEKYGLNPVSLAIAFVLRHPLVASAVFGATKLWQLQQVLDACNVELSDDIIVEINKVHSVFPNPCP
uniref:NADP-dependent oxidoreductase domain-containing protein n=2 Tax=Opuntia streptacantha TaxID=393608 RepID=A0A7C8ZDC8_OPUST